MYGANSDELERIAAEFRRTAENLDSEADILTRVLGGLSWIGDFASRYFERWTGVHIPRIRLSTQFLYDAAQRLDENAKEQRTTSDTDHDGGKSLASQVWRQQREKNKQTVAKYEDKIYDLRSASVEERLAWWNSLSEQERQDILAAMPDHLLAWDDMPPEFVQQAEDAFVSAVASDVVTSTASVEGKLAVNIRIVKIEGGFAYEETTYADGSVSIAFGLDAAAGAEFGGKVDGVELGASVMAGGEVESVYRFATAEEARAFTDGLVEAATPEWGKNPMSAVYDHALEYSEYLESATVAGKLTAEGKANFEVVSASASGEVKVSHDLVDNSTTLSATGTVSGGVSLPDVGGASVEGQASAALTFNGDAEPTELKFTVQGSGQVDVGPTGTLTSTIGGGGKLVTEMTFDLESPAMADVKEAAIAAVKRGDVEGAMSVLQSCGTEAEVVVQSAATISQKNGFDALVVEGSLETSASLTTSTYIKPAGSNEFIEVGKK